ncbi:hypothetical protein KK062_26145 [Fulvivirgaceae bacterium PWU5]|uniref:Uncharacterized protein n=1 Tax=Dawidia cretensis TaxID=2782350 RepID=A0AAP2GW74_9BACT|nr:hypothetical protein [Dawidia cretensis]MBT1711750.1 hypothetical protein [Dawidia cretensis]
MATLRASIYAEQGNVTLLLNAKVILIATGDCEVALKKNSEYVIQWFADGQPGSSYTITVWSPPEAGFQLTRVLGETGKDFGGTRFRT